MALDDYLDSEVAIAVAATAAVLSPRVRGVLRKGAVYGLAGALVAGDAIGSFARGIGRGAQQAASTTADAARTTTGVARDMTEKVTRPAEPVVHAAAIGRTAGVTPATPEDAADELAAVAQGEGDAPSGAGRRSRRTRAEHAEGVANE